MIKQFEDFKRDLDTLCREHGVMLASDGEDEIDVWKFYPCYSRELAERIQALRDRTECSL